MMSDTSADPTDLADGANGYLDRWAGQVMRLTRMVPNT